MRIDDNIFETRVHFEIENGKGRERKMSIAIPKDDIFSEYPTINIPATGDMATGSISEFQKAVSLAVMIANGELTTEDKYQSCLTEEDYSGAQAQSAKEERW